MSWLSDGDGRHSPQGYQTGGNHWDPKKKCMVDGGGNPVDSDGNPIRRRGRYARRGGGPSKLQLPAEGMPEGGESREACEEREASQARWKAYREKYEPDPHHVGETHPGAWPYRKVSPKLPPVEPEPLDPTGEPIDWEACSEKPHLMDILDSSLGELALYVPDELTMWWWRDGWERRSRDDGSDGWFGIDYSMIVRRQLNPLMPDAGSRASLMSLPLHEWPAKAALGWAMWATHGVLPYARQLESLTGYDLGLIQRAVDWGGLPLPLLNLTELSREQVKAMLNGHSKVRLVELRELAEAAFPPPGKLCWFCLMAGRKELPAQSEGWPKRLPSLPEGECPTRTGEVRPLTASEPLRLWTDWLLDRLRAVFPFHFPANSLGHVNYLIPRANELPTLPPPAVQSDHEAVIA